jgi:Lecithin:cholesterol acyltransferase
MRRIKFISLFVTAVSAILFIGACSSTDSAEGSYNSVKVYEKPLLSEIAKKSAAYEGPARNPVIFIHGFLGARLRDKNTGECIWGDFTGKQIMEGFTRKYFRQLAYPMELGKPLVKLPDNLEAVQLLRSMKVSIMAMNFRMAAYQSIINILTNYGYVPECMPLPKDKKFYSLFAFYYDWRDDISENSKRLHDFIMLRKKYLQNKYEKHYGIKNYDVQFDIVAHSMGGLVARYYMRYGEQKLNPESDIMPKLDWRGSKNVDKAIIVATPNAGYLDTCMEMTQGLKLDPDLPVYPPGLLGTFQSYYQMMPVSGMRAVILDHKPGKPEVDMFDPKVWIAKGWGLADPKQDKVLRALLPKVESAQKRRKIALDHLRKCLVSAKKFTKAMSIRSKPPEDIMLILFAGDAVETSRTATIDPKTQKLKVIKWAPGDGKVLSSSAIFDERAGRKWTPYPMSPIKWQIVVNVQGSHMGIMDSYSFIDNLSYYLLAFPSVKRHVAHVYLEKLEKKKK